MPESLRVLILEDNPADVELIQFELQEAGGFVLTSKVVMTEEDFVRELQKFSPDIILSDYDLPEYNGASALAEAQRRCPDIPFILVTGAVSEDRAIEILTQGAKDYVLKTRLDQRLVPAVKRALAETAEHRARKKAEEELRKANAELEAKVNERTAALAAEIEERKQAEEALRENNTRLQKVLEVETVGVMFWDLATGCMTDANETFLKMMGYSRREVEERQLTWQKLTPPEYVEVSLAEIRKFQATGRVGPYEKEYFRKDGTRQWLVFAGSSLGGNACVEFCVDISERKRAEQDVERFSALMDRNPSLVFLKDESGRYVYLNKAYEEHFVGSKDWYGKTDFDFWPKESADLFCANDAEVLRSGRTNQYLEESSDRNGTRYCWLCYKFVFTDSQGRKYLGGIGVDATDRMCAEEALQKAKDELEARVNERTAELESASLYARSLIEASVDPLVTISKEGKITDVNRATEEVTGMARPQLIGSDFADYFTEPDSARKGYRRVLSEGTVRDYPLTIRHAAGRTTDVLYNATLYHNQQGDVQGVFAAARDITELKQAQEALKQINETLEQRVSERTERLDATNKELESFSYSVSHDLRAPLRAIDGYSRMILRNHGDKFDEETKRRFEQIKDAVTNMGQIIDDLLMLSKSGTRELVVRSVDMSRLIEMVWGELRKANPDRDMMLKMNSPVPPGLADEGLIQQVVVNILSNAVKFTRRREMAIIEAAGVECDNEIVYYVRDNGVGFDMQYRDKLFNVFQRLHSADEYEGTGIGMALVQRIIHRHGGRVWAEAEVDKGATFYFTLPTAHE